LQHFNHTINILSSDVNIFNFLSANTINLNKNQIYSGGGGGGGRGVFGI